MSDVADVIYKVSSPYEPSTERSLKFDDPDLAIAWPVTEPLLSERDRSAESFATYRARIAR